MSSSKPSPPPPQQQRAGGWWSDGETTALIDAWGPLYVARNRGSLPAKDWRAAASAVNAHRAAAAGGRFNRTRVQCRTRVQTLKERYKRELAKPPPSGWRHFSRLQAFLAGPEYPPPGFPPKMLAASIKKEEECQEEAVGGGGGGLLGRWAVPTRPRNGAAAWCPAAVVVTKLAEVYERVELARLEVKEKVAMEREKAVQEAVKLKEEKLDT